MAVIWKWITSFLMVTNHLSSLRWSDFSSRMIKISDRGGEFFRHTDDVAILNRRKEGLLYLMKEG